MKSLLIFSCVVALGLYAVLGRPNDLWVRYQLGSLYAQALQDSPQELTDNSKALLKKMLELYPQHEGALVVLGQSALKKHDYQEAVDYFARLKVLHKDQKSTEMALDRLILWISSKKAQKN